MGLCGLKGVGWWSGDCGCGEGGVEGWGAVDLVAEQVWLRGRERGEGGLGGGKEGVKMESVSKMHQGEGGCSRSYIHWLQFGLGRRF